MKSTVLSVVTKLSLKKLLFSKWLSTKVVLMFHTFDQIKQIKEYAH